MAKLPKAMATIRAVFDQYAQQDKLLSKTEMGDLLRKEFGMEQGKNAEADKMFQALDHDGSGSVDFTEFVTFIATLCLMFDD